MNTGRHIRTAGQASSNLGHTEPHALAPNPQANPLLAAPLTTETPSPKPQHPTYSLHCSSFFGVNQNRYYRIRIRELVNQKKELEWRL